MMSTQKLLSRNIHILTFARVIYKRTYLPLIVIYAVSVGVTPAQIGLIAGITAIFSLIIEVPSGYLADRMGHKKSLIISAIAVAITPLCYVVSPNFLGVLLGSVVFFGGIAFQSGTFQAFLQETLDDLKRSDDFVSVSASIQRRSLLINSILITLLPLTYTVDQRLPFLIGFALGASLVLTYFFLKTPSKVISSESKSSKDFSNLVKEVWKKGDFILLLFIGYISANFTKISQFRELYFDVIGIPVEYYGAVIAVSSISGILFTYIVKYLARFSGKIFFIIDIAFVLLIGIVVAYFTNHIIAMGTFVIMMGYYRVRGIVLDNFLLLRCPDKSLKATYLSIVAMLQSIFGIFMPIILGYYVGLQGVQLGYQTYVIGFFVIAIIFYALAYPSLKKYE